jgi:hypothetical protein
LAFQAEWLIINFVSLNFSTKVEKFKDTIEIFYLAAGQAKFN